jgi:RNA polymerase sigma factor (sigma-70 family)
LNEIDIYQKYGQLVYRFALTLTQNAHDAEELTQETFYQAIKSIQRFKGESSLSTWLCQIAKNIWSKELRHRAREQFNDNEVDISINENIEQQLEISEKKFNIYKLVHNLPIQDREIVLLRLNAELSFKEIGTIFGKSENWARVTYYRAKQRILRGMD